MKSALLILTLSTGGWFGSTEIWTWPIVLPEKDCQEILAETDQHDLKMMAGKAGERLGKTFTTVGCQARPWLLYGPV